MARTRKTTLSDDMLPPEKSFQECVDGIRRSIEALTKKAPEPWLLQAIEGAAMEEQALRHYHRGVMTCELLQISPGSMGQKKTEANVMIPHREKSSRTLNQWLVSLGLTGTTTSKVKDATGTPEEDDLMKNYYK